MRRRAFSIARGVILLFATLLAFLFHIPCGAVSETNRRLPPLEAKLYRYIAETQFAEGWPTRYLGGWPVYSRLHPGQFFSHETTSFLTLQEMLVLAEVEQTYYLPEFTRVAHLANRMFARYLFDAGHTHEPAGTIAYWPILNYSTGRRGIDHPASRVLPLFNIPNDFDTSSQAFLWFHKSDQAADFRNAFVTTVGRYRDLGRTRQHINDNRWKSVNSGAFMTWAEPEKSADERSRIFSGINDVDCVVNLNILTALATYQRSAQASGALPESTAEGMLASCQLMAEALRQHEVPACAAYYGRPSQFWFAFMRARLAGASCLEPAEKLLLSKAVSRARNIARQGLMVPNATEAAEILLVLKKLYPASGRSPDVTNVIDRLEQRLRASIRVVGEKAYGATEDTLYLAVGKGLRLDWYSPAYSAALILWALTTP